jgi:hypothetical protein
VFQVDRNAARVAAEMRGQYCYGICARPCIGSSEADLGGRDCAILSAPTTMTGSPLGFNFRCPRLHLPNRGETEAVPGHHAQLPTRDASTFRKRMRQQLGVTDAGRRLVKRPSPAQLQLEQVTQGRDGACRRRSCRRCGCSAAIEGPFEGAVAVAQSGWRHQAGRTPGRWRRWCGLTGAGASLGLVWGQGAVRSTTAEQTPSALDSDTESAESGTP